MRINESVRSPLTLNPFNQAPEQNPMVLPPGLEQSFTRGAAPRQISRPAPAVSARPFTHFNQDIVAKDPNACGTTSLAMVLANMGLIPRTYAAAKQLDQQMRPGGIFTTPSQLTRAANAHGIHAAGINHATIDDLRKQLAAGHKVMAMLDGPHWVVVTGVIVRKGVECVVTADPAYPDDPKDRLYEGERGFHVIEASAFFARGAAPLGAGYVQNLTGFSNYIHVFSTEAVQSRDSDLRATNEIATTATSFVNGLALIGEGNATGVSSVLGSLLSVPHALVVAPISAAFGAEAGGVASVVDTLVTGGGPAMLGGAIAAAAGADEKTKNTVETVVNAIFNPIGFLVHLFGG